METAILVVTSLSLVAIVTDLVISARILVLKRSSDWLRALADEGVALAEHTKAAHKAQSMEYSAKDAEQEAVHWMLSRAEALKVKCSRSTAAKMVAISMARR